jgi:Tfp pilus assembly protein PilO
MAVMGWGRTLLLGNIGAQLNIDDVERDVEQVKEYLQSQQADHDSQQANLKALQQETHDLKLYLATLMRLLVSKNILSQDELKRFVDLVDPSDSQS